MNLRIGVFHILVLAQASLFCACFAQQEKSPYVSDRSHAIKITNEFAIDTTYAHQIPEEEIGCVFYDSAGSVLHRERARYPETERGQGRKGKVWVKAFVDSAGTVIYARILSSDDSVFNKASLEAMMQFRFSPAILDGKLSATWISMPFRFESN